MPNPRQPIRAKKGSAIRSAVPRPTFRLASLCVGFLDSAQDRIFDRLLGVSTREILITEGSVFTAGRDNCPYSGSQWLPLRRALMGLAPGPSDVFVDLGSGKGKALLVAGRLPYRRVVGVEIDEELSRYSRRNIERVRPRLRAQEVESITASVLEWPIPDETSVVFMYNPFIGQTFRAAASQIFESYDRRPRTLHIVYRYPWEHDWLVSTGRVVVDSVRPGNWPARPRWWQSGHVIVSYRVVGNAAGSQSRILPRRLIRPHRAIQRWSRPNGYRFTMSAPGQETFCSRS
jgi:SAM-dependent methyltransferase